MPGYHLLSRSQVTGKSPSDAASPAAVAGAGAAGAAGAAPGAAGAQSTDLGARTREMEAIFGDAGWIVATVPLGAPPDEAWLGLSGVGPALTGVEALAARVAGSGAASAGGARG